MAYIIFLILGWILTSFSFFLTHSLPNFTLTDRDNNQTEYNKHYAVWHTVSEEWLGTKAIINLWETPGLNFHAYSTSGITLSNDNGFYNAIGAGFHVRPEFYNNHDLRFFVYWTVDGTTECYYDTCPGFVIADTSPLEPGQAVKPVSAYSEDNYYVIIRIMKDNQTGNWQLFRDDPTPKLLGWWPQSLFTSLSTNATYVEWGGSVGSLKNETSPPMGSGHFSDEGETKSAYIRHITLFDANRNARYPLNGDVQVEYHQDRQDCYTVSKVEKVGDNISRFYYGGPGGC